MHDSSLTCEIDSDNSVGAHSMFVDLHYSLFCAFTFPMLISGALFGQSNDEAKNSQWTARNVAIVVYDEVEPLDFVGPGEVFGAAANRAGVPGRPAFNVYTVAVSTEPVRSRFMTLQPDYSISDCPSPDIIVIPGGSTRKLLENRRFMQWIEDETKKDTTTLTVCTGARVLAELGLLDGKRATTHHGVFAHFKSTYPEVEMVAGARFVDQSNLITSAGVSAGIDGALHLVAKLHGRKVATQTASYMEYDWEPDLKMFASYPDHNPLLNTEEQLESDLMISGLEQDQAGIIRSATELLRIRPDDQQLRYRLGTAQLGVRMLDDAIVTLQRVVNEADGLVRTNAYYNLACCHALKGNKELALSSLQNAIEAGYSNKSHARSDSDLRSLHGTEEFERIIDQSK